jgi:hypothetical protein
LVKNSKNNAAKYWLYGLLSISIVPALYLCISSVISFLYNYNSEYLSFIADVQYSKFVLLFASTMISFIALRFNNLLLGVVGGVCQFITYSVFKSSFDYFIISIKSLVLFFGSRNILLSKNISMIIVAGITAPLSICFSLLGLLDLSNYPTILIIYNHLFDNLRLQELLVQVRI